MIEQRVTLRYGAQQIPPCIQAVQGDTGRDIIFELVDYEIPEGATVNYYVEKPSGEAVYNSASVLSPTEIYAHLTQQAIVEVGRSNGQVRILIDDEVITSFKYVIEVEKFLGADAIPSGTETNIFDDALQAAAEDAIEEIQAQTPVVTGMQNSIAPTYSSSSTYAVGDYVMYNATLYRCTTAITTAEAWTVAHWTQVSLGSDVTDLKNALNNTNVIISGGTYSAKVGDITEGGRIGPTGVYAANAQWCYGYVDVHLFKSITVSQIGISDTTIINTCDSNKTHRRNLKTWAEAGTYNYTLEDGDYYLCISAQIVDMPIVIITSNFDGIIKDINDNADDIEEMNQRYNADMGFPILTINTTTSTSWSKKIIATFDLKQGYKYRFTITGESTNSRYLALCNSGGTSLASYNKTSDGYFDYVPETNLTGCYLDYRSNVSGADAVVSYLIVSPTIMSRLETVEGSKQIVISGNVFAVVGDKLQIFYRSFIEGLTDTDIVKFSCDIGKNYPRYWEVTPVAGDVGNHTITINIYDSNGGIIASKTCILNVVSASNPGNMKNVLCIGDSTMANGQIPIEASRRIKGTSGIATSPTPLSLSNISFTGRKENADHTVGWEGTGGWTFVNYMQAGVDAVRFTVTGATDINIDDVYSINSFRLRIAEINVTSGNGNIRCTFDYKPSGSSWDATAQTGTLTKYSGNGQQAIAFTAWVSESFQPFWNNNTNTFDIETYVDTYCSGHADVICILLGINSVISRDPFASMEDLVNNYAKVFAGMIHEQLPSSKIIMSTLPPASPNGGIGSNYGSGANSGAFSAVGFNHKIFEYNKLLLGLNADSSINSYLTVVNTHAQFDPEYGYPSESVPVNSRQTETTTMQTNAVHPNDGGYWQVSDAMAFRSVLALIG